VSYNIEDIITPYSGLIDLDGNSNELMEMKGMIQEVCKIYQNKVVKPK
jgi:hypothetical protein